MNTVIMRVFVIIIQLVFIVAVFLFVFYEHTALIDIEVYKGVSIVAKYLFFFALIDTALKIFRFIYTRSIHLKSGKKNTFLSGISNIAKVVLGIGLIVTTFELFGIDFKSLLTSLSIVAAAIAIISKDYISDFLVGIYFSFSKNFEMGDYVKIGDKKGKIHEIELLKLNLLNDDDDLVIIPNSKVYSSEIINYTKRDIRQMSVDFQIDIKSIENIEKLQSELIAALEAFSGFIEKDSFNLKIVEFKKDCIDFKFQYRLKSADRELQKNIRRRTVREIFNHISGRNAARAIDSKAK
ncbi:MAG: mechanosensitive ion channel [Bacteroidetes bacterium]|nr:mechanosensitive ion channel [Bacteroidota bacterium]MCB0852801.1 mechanosensitive ion channel [Bacteroidota bacterium]